jgi:hypothetical protein
VLKKVKILYTACLFAHFIVSILCEYSPVPDFAHKTRPSDLISMEQKEITLPTTYSLCGLIYDITANHFFFSQDSK